LTLPGRITDDRDSVETLPANVDRLTVDVAGCSVLMRLERGLLTLRATINNVSRFKVTRGRHKTTSTTQ